MSETLRWGIVGTGDICRQFASDLALLDDAALLAVASRREATANAFGDRFAIPKRHSSYESLADDPDVDVVYIGTPHPYHMENALLFLRHGKHVLCEKPLAMNTGQVEAIFECAEANDRFVMEAMWMYFFPAMRKARALLEEGAVGAIHFLRADFCFEVEFDARHRLFNPELGGGALLDTGIYPLALAQMVFDEEPVHIASRVRKGPTGVDALSSILLEYPSGGVASLNNSLLFHTPQEAVIAGSEGTLIIPPRFSQPDRLRVQRGDAVEAHEFEREGFGYYYEAAEVTGCIRDGVRESRIMPWDASRLLHQTMDRIRDQWDLRYPMEAPPS